jgi:hypothetical protein
MPVMKEDIAEVDTEETLPVIKEEVWTEQKEVVTVMVNEVEKEEEAKDMEKRFKRKQEENNKIENPLPIPKKKEKKIMDFAFQPNSFEMMYDIRVSDKDDFDV